MNVENENFIKKAHGAKGINALESMIDVLKEKKYISMFQKRYRIADPNYIDKQFYFQFLIEFYDKEQWILQSTTSIRDRIAGHQWHSEHIKRLNAYVKKAYVVVPDGLDLDESEIARKNNEKIVQGKIYSALDGVVSLENVYQMIEKKATSLMESGQAHAKLGLHFEEKLVASLNDGENLEKWKNKSSTSVGYLYSLYCDVLKFLSINPAEVMSIYATSDIPKLPSGGSPKTDVLVKIRLISGEKIYTFSCKRSSAECVSVHEYTAESFSKVLNPEDMELKRLLQKFQDVGGVRAMGEVQAKELEERLVVYKKALCKWVLGGIGGEGESTVQWASHIITMDELSNTYNIATIDEYIQEFDKRGIKGQFGTPFRWTYPSKGQGKRIQLKIRIK